MPERKSGNFVSYKDLNLEKAVFFLDINVIYI